MKNKKRIIIVLLLLLLTTGCTKQLTDSNNKPVKNETTGQTLTENIICKPTNKETYNIYKENKIKVDKLPDCEEFKITDGKYESLWNSFIVKPMAFLIIFLGKFVKNYGLSVIIISLLIRLIAYPVTKKTAMQSELMQKAQPELTRIQKKYANKQDEESMMKQNQEMLAVYQKTPVIFEDKFLGLQLGTTPAVGIGTSTFYIYAILVLLIGLTTHLSFKMNGATATDDPTMKMMPTMMSVMIIVTSIFMPTGLGIYWVTSNLFTIVQNKLVKRSKANGKA